MARGKANKLRKAERESAKAGVDWSRAAAASATAAAAAAAAAPPVPLPLPVPDGDADDHADADSAAAADAAAAALLGYHDTAGMDCDHQNLSAARMRKVSRLLSELFSTSFRLAVPSLFRGMIQNLQDSVLKEKLASFVDHGYSPVLIQKVAKSGTTKAGIKTQINLACEEELGDVVLRLSTEDCFDLLCDLAVRHGRDLRIWGPPCACSFSHCLPCLEKLVQSVNQTPPIAPAEIRDLDSTCFIGWLETLVKAECVDEGWVENDPEWRSKITGAWTTMSQALWEAAAEIDPMSLPKVKEALKILTELDGLDLYYTIVTREVMAMESCTSTLAHSGGAKPSELTLSARSSGDSLSLSAHYERMKKETQQAAGSAAPRGNHQATETGAKYRKALARAIREQGNAAYESQRYTSATEHYTRAIGYDATEAIYPLNRAACLIKLRRYVEAEVDCTAALILSPENHKAFFRRGVSRVGQGKKEEARRDFEQVLRLQEKNPAVREELQRLSEQVLCSVDNGGGGGGAQSTPKADPTATTQLQSIPPHPRALHVASTLKPPLSTNRDGLKAGPEPKSKGKEIHTSTSSSATSSKTATGARHRSDKTKAENDREHASGAVTLASSSSNGSGGGSAARTSSQQATIEYGEYGDSAVASSSKSPAVQSSTAPISPSFTASPQLGALKVSAQPQSQSQSQPQPRPPPACPPPPAPMPIPPAPRPPSHSHETECYEAFLQVHFAYLFITLVEARQGVRILRAPSDASAGAGANAEEGGEREIGSGPGPHRSRSSSGSGASASASASASLSEGRLSDTESSAASAEGEGGGYSNGSGSSSGHARGYAPAPANGNSHPDANGPSSGRSTQAAAAAAAAAPATTRKVLHPDRAPARQRAGSDPPPPRPAATAPAAVREPPRPSPSASASASAMSARFDVHPHSHAHAHAHSHTQHSHSHVSPPVGGR